MAKRLGWEMRGPRFKTVNKKKEEKKILNSTCTQYADEYKEGKITKQEFFFLFCFKKNCMLSYLRIHLNKKTCYILTCRD